MIAMKKTFSVLLLLCLLLPCACGIAARGSAGADGAPTPVQTAAQYAALTAFSSDAGTILFGDVNGDGNVNKKDSLALKKYLADNSNPIDLAAADVMYDGAVNKKDSLRLKQYLAGWEVSLGMETEAKLSVDLQPVPLSATVSENAAEAAPASLLTPSDGAYDGIFTRFGFEVGQGGLPVTVTTDETLGEEEYKLTVGKNAVTIRASGTVGVFRAVSTLAQLRCGKYIAAAEIEDKPAVALRGAIEGFYGDAWSHQYRLDLFEYMGNYKLNTYIYAPKDDPKHRANWRVLYTAAEKQKMAELVARAQENCVHFVYAISPGLSIDLGAGYDSDFEKLCQKCQSMYDIGVRDFAIFLDDIGSRDAEGHAKLLNDFQTKFVKTHEGCADLVAITPEYEKIWLTGYTDTFAALVDPDILLMWTGNETLPKSIKVSDLTGINQKYGRKVYIWWNYPCNDFSRNSLYSGPCVNLDKNLAGSISGLVSNPMNKGYASMLPMLTIADYLWNPTDYDPERSIVSACAHLVPDCAEGLYDLMDLTRDAQINDGKTSLQLADLIKAYEISSGWEAGEALAAALDRISAELATLSEKGDRRLLAEIDPWLTKARAYVDAARAVVDFYRAENAAARGEAAMRCVNAYRQSLGSAAFVSGDVLEPFVKKARAGMIFSNKNVTTDLVTYQTYLPEFATDGDPSTWFWSDGAPGKGSHFTVDLGQVTEASGVRLSMGVAGHTDDYIRNGVIEYSLDGVSYTKLCDLNGSSSVETNEPFTARYLRLRCTAKQNYWVIITEFGVKSASDRPKKSASTNLATYQTYAPGLAIDGDPSTYFWSDGAPGVGSTFTVDLGAALEVSGVELTMGAAGHTDDYIRKGVIEYSTDGESYTKLCDLNGTRSLKNDDPFTARYVRLRCTAGQSNWVIITEFAVKCAADLPAGVTCEGQGSADFSTLFDRDLFTVFSPEPKAVAGSKLYIEPTNGGSVELYLAALTGVRVYTVDKDGNAGADLSLAPYMAPDMTGAARLCIEFTAERAGIAEIVIG